MRELHLFAGVGGGILGGILLGHTPVCAVEVNPYCRDVLFQRQRDGVLPRFPIWDDIRTFEGTLWRGRVDVVAGGFPCQRFSGASRGRRVAPDLWPEMLRVVREVEPAIVFSENVARAPILHAAMQLRDLGYCSRIARVTSAMLGAPHNRVRWWLLADTYGNGERGLRVDAEVAESPAPPRGIWAAKPDPAAMGMDDGLSRKMDRLAALGNAQVPAVAALAWRTLATANAPTP